MWNHYSLIVDSIIKTFGGEGQAYNQTLKFGTLRFQGVKIILFIIFLKQKFLGTENLGGNCPEYPAVASSVGKAKACK